MDISPRMQQILIVLLYEEDPIAINKLAEKIGISKRTIQRELVYIDRVLKDLPLNFASKTGKGVWLEGTREEKQALLQELSKGNTYDASNREERRKRLTLEILKDKGLKKIYYYSSLFDVSESTIGSDLKVIEKWLEEYDLKVVRKPGSGVEIQGQERNYRRAIRVFIDENIDTQMIRDAYEKEETEQEDLLGVGTGMIAQILDKDILERVIHCVSSLDDERIWNFTESSYVGLILHITIAINRIVKDEFIEDEVKTPWPLEENDGDYQLAERIVRELEREFHVTIPPLELSYICLHIKGAKHTEIAWERKGQSNIQRKEILGLVNALIDAYNKEIAFELKQDDEFIQGLLAHLQPTIIRLANHMKINNPMLEDIKREYSEVYSDCIKAAKVLEDWLNEPIPEEEIGFLAIHFGAALVRLEGRRENLRKVYVGVVCESGIGISRLMLTKIEKHFKDRINLVAYGRQDITPYLISRTDFFISSIALDLQDTVVVDVNPLLSKQDMDAIERQVSHFEHLPRKEERQDDFTMELDQVNMLAMQIKTVIRYLELVLTDEQLSFSELLQQIGDKMSPYADRSEVIQEDLMRREKLATQIFAEFGFALLHTRTSGVVRPGISIWRTASGNPFQDSYFKGIHLIVCMLLPDDENKRINSDIMGYISSMLIEDYELLQMMQEGNEETIREKVSVCLRHFFMQKINTTTF